MRAPSRDSETTMMRLALCTAAAAAALAGWPVAAQEHQTPHGVSAPQTPTPSTPGGTASNALESSGPTSPGTLAPPPSAPSPPAAAAPPSASVDVPPGATENGRYAFYRVRESFMRLDTRTGQVSQCGWSATGWACQAVPNERTALESEIARLQSENAALKKELFARGMALPNGVKSDPPLARAPDAKPDAKGPTEAELDRVLGFMEKVWRRLVEMMAELQRDIQRKG
jgi:hypothetical protein